MYIMSNSRNTVLYTGVTNDLTVRVAEHLAGVGSEFTCRYKCRKLVYYESGGDIEAAIRREKQVKRWHRDWKDALIVSMNPEWRDLSGDVGVTDALVAEVRRSSRAPGRTPESHPRPSP